MKILVFHPHHDALQELAGALAPRGVAMVFATTTEEANGLVQIHGQTLDLIWVHTDGALPGLTWLGELKQNAATHSIATLVSTESWTDAQCAEHQASAAGANAYLHWPVTQDALVTILDQMFPTAGTDDQGISLDSPPQDLPELSLELSSASSAGVNTSALDLGLPLEMPQQQASGPEGSLVAMTHGDSKVSEFLPSTANHPAHAADPVDSAVAAELPYLFRKKMGQDPQKAAAPETASPSLVWGDAVVPGGAAQSPDLETLKKYLMLREQDVAALSHQLKAAREQISTFEANIRESQAIQAELKHMLDESQRRITGFEAEKGEALAQQGSRMRELEFEVKSKTDRLNSLEQKVKEATSEVDQIKERVRQDIRKIRVREKELENKLEIVRRDSEALLGARESKIIELKRRLDLLEFNMDLLQDQYNRSKEQNKKLEEKLARAAQVVRVAGGMLVEEKSA